MQFSLDPAVMRPRGRCYFTPLLWEADASLETSSKEWKHLRDVFKKVRSGDFSALDGLPTTYASYQDIAAQVFVRNLLGDAGTDAHLEEVVAYARDTTDLPEKACELCHALGLWARLSAVEDIYAIYERNFGGQYAEGLPAYLTTMLEASFGPVARHPELDDDDAFFAYEALLQDTVEKLAPVLGSTSEYALLGGPTSVRGIAEHLLRSLDSSPRSRMMRPFLRQRFEASTGIDCSGFFEEGSSRPLTTASILEAWLASPESENFVPKERYFFGHRIPRPQPK